MTIPSSQLSPWTARENKMSNTVVEQPGHLLITAAQTKLYMEIHKEHFYPQNPSGFLLLWLQAVNTAPVSEQETGTDAAAHRISFAVHDLPSAPLYCLYQNPLLPFLSKLQKPTLNWDNSWCVAPHSLHVGILDSKPKWRL